MIYLSIIIHYLLYETNKLNFAFLNKHNNNQEKDMRLDGRRKSNNVDDRRGLSGGARAGIGGGIVGIILVAAVTLFSGGSLSDVLSNVMGSGAMNGVNIAGDYESTPEDEALADFASKILAGTEDVWTKEFRENGWGDYECPKLVLFHGAVNSGCGQASSQTGPFYCSADQTVYIDLDFFKDMKRTIGADGDFAYAYVIAHEVGHHVQQQLGILDVAHSQMSRLSETEANKISVRLELQADFLAGVWAHQDNAMFNSLEPGDLQKAIDAASKIGDDYLQKKAYGYEIPDAFNHGRSSQRVKWLTKGFQTGDVSKGDTFSMPYNEL